MRAATRMWCFPIDTLRAMVEEGTLGGLGPHAYTFMGGIYSSRLVRDKLAPAIADRVVADEVDVYCWCRSDLCVISPLD